MNKNTLKIASSVFVISLVACMVIALATYLVVNSVSDPHSNVKLLASVLEHTEVSHVVAAQDQTVPTIPKEHISENASKKVCASTITEAAQQYNYSVENLLFSHAIPGSYEDRVPVAEEIGIERYHGTADQNKELFAELVVKYEPDRFINCK